MNQQFIQEGLHRFLDSKKGTSSSSQKSIEKQKKILKSLENVKYVVSPEFCSFVNFSQARNVPVHRWFKYREGYSPELVHAFLRNEERKVLDPFCGSGTTLVCALKKGINSIGIDINPMATFVSKVKTRRYTRSDVTRLRELSKEIIDVDSDIYPADPPKLRIIDKVFPGDVLDYLLHMKTSINSVIEGKHRDFLFLGWLAILESVSNTRKEGNGIKYRSTRRTRKGYVHIPFDIWRREYYGNDAIGFAKEKLQAQFNKMFNDVKNYFLNLPHCETAVHRGDARRLTEILHEEKISTAIFSPPYANCFDYFEIFKVELWMGGFVNSYAHLRELRKSSFGSLWQPLPKDDLEIQELRDLINLIEKQKPWDEKIISMLIAYFSNMKKVLSEIYDVLFPGGKCVIIVGNSAYSNVLIPTDLLLAKIGQESGFTPQKLIIARHLTTSSQQKKKLEQLKQYLRESIIILQK